MAFVVRSKSGKVVGTYATRGEAEAWIARLRAWWIEEIRNMLDKAGYAGDLQKHAERLVREGYGPEEIAHRIKTGQIEHNLGIQMVKRGYFKMSPEHSWPGQPRRHARAAKLGHRRAQRSPARAGVIQRAYDAYERARETFDPKRFKRGGGYTLEDRAAIARLAGTHQPSNRALGHLELERFKSEPPGPLFAYYRDAARVGSPIVTFVGGVLGHVTWRGQEQRKFGGGRSVAIRMRGVNGVTYGGTCNLTGGDYCRLRPIKAEHSWRGQPRRR